jgi:hypothetical protein
MRDLAIEGARYTTLNAEQAQATFEAMFDHTPKIDIRTPADIKAARSKP